MLTRSGGETVSVQTTRDNFYLIQWNGNSYPPDEGNQPVVFVSWYAAMAYAEWAGKRLPTEGGVGKGKDSR